MELLIDILQDMFFAALAAVGFASISNTPFSVIKYCALLGAVGHGLRFVLMQCFEWHIVASAAIASLAVGLLAVMLCTRVKCPPETFSYPSLLPMIPGMYAYRAVQGLVMCLSVDAETEFEIIILGCSNTDFDDEYPATEQVQLINGDWVNKEYLKCNAFDFISILIRNAKGRVYTILGMELS